MKIPTKYISCGVFIALLTIFPLYLQTLPAPLPPLSMPGITIPTTPVTTTFGAPTTIGTTGTGLPTTSTIAGVQGSTTVIANPTYPTSTTFPIITTANQLLINQPLTTQQIQSFLTEAASPSLSIFGLTPEEKSKLQIYQNLLMGVFSDKTDPDLISKILLNLASDIGIQSTTLRTMAVERLVEGKKALDYGKKLANDTISRYGSQNTFSLAVTNLKAALTALNNQSTNIDNRIKINLKLLQDLNTLKVLVNLPDKITRYRTFLQSVNAQILEPTLTGFTDDLGRLIVLVKQQPTTDAIRNINLIFSEAELNNFIPVTTKAKLTELKTFLTAPAATPAAQAGLATPALPASTGLPVATGLGASPLTPIPTTPGPKKTFLNPFETKPQTNVPALELATTKGAQGPKSIEEIKKSLEVKDGSYSSLVTTCSKAVNLLKTNPSKELSTFILQQLGEKLSLAYNGRAYQKPENIIELHNAFKAAAEFKEFASVVTPKRLETLSAAAQISIAQTQTVSRSKIASLTLAMNMIKKDADNYEKILFINELMSLFSNRAKYTQEELKKASDLLTLFTGKENLSLKIFDKNAYKKATDWANIVQTLIVLTVTPTQKTFKDLISLYKSLFNNLALPAATYEREKFILIIRNLFYHRVNLFQDDLKELKAFFEEISNNPNIISIQEIPNILTFVRKIGKTLQFATNQKSYIEVILDKAKTTNDLKLYTKVVQGLTTHTPERLITALINSLNNIIQVRNKLDKKEVVKLLKLTNYAKFADTVKINDKPIILPNSPRKRAIEAWITTIDKE